MTRRSPSYMEGYEDGIEDACGVVSDLVERDQDAEDLEREIRTLASSKSVRDALDDDIAAVGAKIAQDPDAWSDVWQCEICGSRRWTTCPEGEWCARGHEPKRLGKRLRRGEVFASQMSPPAFTESAGDPRSPGDGGSAAVTASVAGPQGGVAAGPVAKPRAHNSDPIAGLTFILAECDCALKSGVEPIGCLHSIRKKATEMFLTVAKCSHCSGDGEYLPTCFRCDDSTDDHDCRGPRPCTECGQTGFSKAARAAMTTLGVWPKGGAL